MENKNFIERLADILGQNATVKNVYGDPVILKDKTIIPVAKISFGFGGGFSPATKKRKLHRQDNNIADVEDQHKGGGGGGLSARAAGVYEVTTQKTRFISANNNRQLLLAVLCGFLLKGFFKSTKK